MKLVATASNCVGSKPDIAIGVLSQGPSRALSVEHASAAASACRLRHPLRRAQGDILHDDALRVICTTVLHWRRAPVPDRHIGLSTARQEQTMKIALAQPNSRLPSILRPLFRPFHLWLDRFLPRSRAQWPLAAAAPVIYQIADRLHNQRIAQVTCDSIATTVSAWLAELGVQSPFAEDLAQAVRRGDWAAVYAIGEQLSVQVTVAGSC